MKREMIRKDAKLYIGIELIENNLGFINKMIYPGIIEKDSDNNSNRLLYKYYNNTVSYNKKQPKYDEIDNHTEIFVCVNRSHDDEEFVLIQFSDTVLTSINNHMFAKINDVITVYDVITPNRDYIKNNMINKIADRVYRNGRCTLSVNLVSTSAINSTTPIVTITYHGDTDEENKVLTLTKSNYVAFMYGYIIMNDLFSGVKAFTEKDLEQYVCIPKEDCFAMD